VVVDQSKAEEHSCFEFETEKLGRVCCRPLNFKLLFRFTDLIKSAPDTVPDFVCTLLSIIGERRDAAVPEDRVISVEQAKALTDRELEQFAAKFLEAANWIGPCGKAQPTSEGTDECSYGERLKRAFEAYEKGLTEHTKPYVFSDVVPSGSGLGLRLLRGASIEARTPAFGDPIKKSFSGNGGIEQRQRAAGAAHVKFKRFFANIWKKWQKQSSRLGAGAGAVAFSRKKTGSNSNVATVGDTRVQNSVNNHPLPVVSSDLLLVPSAERGEVCHDPFEQVTGYVGKGCRIVGEAFFQGSIRIDGQVEGTIGANDLIVVGQSGTITTASPIKAAEVIIAGMVRGNIVASKRIAIYAPADVMGNLSAPIIAIEAGATLEGCCSTTPRSEGLDCLIGIGDLIN